MNETKYWLIDSYNDTLEFNDLAGNTTKLALQNVKNQTKLILEEAGELEEAVNENDAVGVLDAVVDLYVVLDGLTAKLVSLGFDLPAALHDTNENNLSKFPTSKEVADATVEKYKSEGIETTATFNETHGRWVIKDTNGKVRKPVGYVSNNLSHCLPTPDFKFEE